MSAAKPKYYRSWGGMCWPAPGEAIKELGWRLRYQHAPMEADSTDRLLSASVVSAYIELINMPQRKRNEIIRELRKGPGTAALALAGGEKS